MSPRPNARHCASGSPATRDGQEDSECGWQWTDPRYYRLTIEDFDPTWSEWHLDRTADVHGTPASERHYWTLNGRWNDGYEPGAVCGLSGWRPDRAADALGD